MGLIALILIASSYFLTPKDAPKAEKAVVVATEKNIHKETYIHQNSLDTALFKYPFGKLLQGQEQLYTLENENLRIILSNKGGQIKSVVFKKFKDYKGNNVSLFQAAHNFGFKLLLNNNKTIATSDLYFTVQPKQSNHLVLVAKNADNQWIEYDFNLPQNALKLSFDVRTKGLGDVLSEQQRNIELDWSASLTQQEKDINYERQYSSLYYKSVNGDVDWLSEGSDDKKELTEEKTEWVSFKQRFFTSVLVYNKGFEKALVEVKNASKTEDVLRHYDARLFLPYDARRDNHYQMEFVFSHNKYKVLQAQGHDLEKQVRLGWWILKWINRIAVVPIFSLLEGMNLNYGIIILILTVLLKLILSPLTYKSYLSMAKMRVLKPEIDELKEKIGADNAMLLQQEQLKIYKQAGVNPLGGCIPLLLQLPITIAFFYFFPNLFELRGQSFLWMTDLSTYDAVITFPAIPLLGWDHLSLMCLLMTISTLIYTYYNNEISGVSGEMKYLGYITPLIFLGVLNSYPSGLNFYYFCANMLTFAQQYLIKKFVDEDKIHAKIQENKKKKPAEKKKSGFQARLESYMREQQQKKTTN